MKVQFRQTFAKDLEHIRDKRLLERIKEVVQFVERAESLEEFLISRSFKGEATSASAWGITGWDWSFKAVKSPL